MEYDDLKEMLKQLGSDGIAALEQLAQQTIQDDKNFLFNSLIKGNSNLDWKLLREKLDARSSRRLVVNFNHEGFKYSLIIQNHPIVDESVVERETATSNGKVKQ